MKRYAAYKDSGVEWLGEVPKGWDICSARRIFRQVREAALDGDEQLSATQKSGVIPQRLYMTQEDQKVVLALSGLGNFKHVEAGDFVISLRSFQGGIEFSEYSGCVSPAYTVLRQTKALYAGFYRHLLKSDPYISILQSVTTGIRDGRNVSYEQFGLVGLPLPPSAEQRAIADFLDRETVKIDALVEEQRRLIALLAEKRQAVISHAVTKGLNPDAPLKPSGIDWLGDIPEGWEVVPLRILCRIQRGKFTHRPRNDPAFYDGDYPFIQTGDIAGASRFISTYRQTLNERGASVSKEFPAGTLVMAIAANLGDVAILNFDAFFPDSIVGLVPRPKATVNYLYYLMTALKPALLTNATMSTQLNINADQIAAIIATLPSIDEQNEISEHIDGVLSKLDALTSAAISAIALLQERRAALISAAVTGKIDVTDEAHSLQEIA